MKLRMNGVSQVAGFLSVVLLTGAMRGKIARRRICPRVLLIACSAGFFVTLTAFSSAARPAINPRSQRRGAVFMVYAVSGRRCLDVP